MRRVIAIDGPSGSGKTTIAKIVALELGYSYLDTGALYRAVAFSLRKKGVNPEDSDEVISAVLEGTTIELRNGRVFLNGNDVGDDIRSKDIDHYSSVFSARQIVRDFLLDLQRNALPDQDLVVEGRDTTTVVFPDAREKIFLDASVEERAKRRFLQYREKGLDVTFEEVVRSIRERDARDASRDIAPLARIPEAFFIDSSHLSIEEVKNIILDYVRRNP